MRGGDAAFVVCAIATLAVSAVAGLAVLLSGWPLALWVMLPLPVLVIATVYLAIGVGPRLLKGTTNGVFAIVCACGELILVLLILGLPVWMPVLAGIVLAATVLVAPTRFVGA
jgi:hypothetical protein